MAVDYVAWIEDVLRRKPHLNQSGLAKVLGRDRSVVTMIRKRERALRADEIQKIATYFNEPPPGDSAVKAPFAPIVGRVGDYWYEEGKAPPAAGNVSPVLKRINARQEAYIIDSPVMDIPAGAHILVMPIERNITPQDGDLIVVKRSKVGLVNLTLARYGHTKDEPIAIVIEVRFEV